jgi:DNA-binding transcriptional LysR family regulator
MDIDLIKLRHVLAIARTRSFSRAAETLNLTQPAVSRSIASLELSFGLKLFDRSRRGVEPTEMGKLVIAEAEKVVRAAHDLSHNMRMYSRGEAGELSVGVGPMMAMTVPSLLQPLLQRSPGLRLRILSGSSGKLGRELANDQIELILGSTWDLQGVAGLQMEILGSIRVAILVRANHPLTRLDRVAISDLRDYPVASATDDRPAALTTNTGALVCDNYHLLREMVLTTDCLWLASPTLLARDLADGRLAQIAAEDFSGSDVEIAVLWRSRRTLSPAAEALIAETRRFLSSRYDKSKS